MPWELGEKENGGGCGVSLVCHIGKIIFEITSNCGRRIFCTVLRIGDVRCLVLKFEGEFSNFDTSSKKMDFTLKEMCKKPSFHAFETFLFMHLTVHYALSRRVGVYAK
jgi:hypothetical protein